MEWAVFEISKYSNIFWSNFLHSVWSFRICCRFGLVTKFTILSQDSLQVAGWLVWTALKTLVALEAGLAEHRGMTQVLRGHWPFLVARVVAYHWNTILKSFVMILVEPCCDFLVAVQKHRVLCSGFWPKVVLSPFGCKVAWVGRGNCFVDRPSESTKNVWRCRSIPRSFLCLEEI